MSDQHPQPDVAIGETLLAADGDRPRRVMEQRELRAALAGESEPGELAMMATILPESLSSGAFDETLYPGELEQSLTLPPEQSATGGLVEVARPEEVPDGSERERIGAGRGRYASLPLLELERGDEGHAPHFVLGEVLGQGGTGVVRKAQQAALGRDVAIKSLHQRLATDLDVYLLREARLTGMLEHPNIIPVYALGVDRGGQLLLVMKRVEGVPWSTLIHDPEHPMWAELGDDQERWHVETLMQICHAVHYAHSMGVIHRDLKPDNVMVGAFGQVYLLDWGVALATDDRVAVRGIVGTPAYMAPEMANPEPEAVSPRTDVYLLGGVLHEILTGRPPHSHRTLAELFKSLVHEEALTLDELEGLNEGLQRIARQALEWDPGDRFPDAQALRQALTEHLQHRAAFALLKDAQARLADIRALLSALGEQEVTTPYAIALNRTFAEGRFAFLEALEALPESAAPEASEGLQELIERMVRFELLCRNPIVATALLDDLPRPNPALEAEIRALEAQMAAREEELERLQDAEHERDLDVGRGSRGLFMLVLGVLMGLLPLTVAALNKTGVAGVPPMVGLILGAVGILALLAAAIWRFRRSILPNAVSRTIILGIIALVTAIGFHRMLHWLTLEQERLSYAEFVQLFTSDMYIVAVGLVILGLATDRHLLFTTPIFVVGFLLAALTGPEAGMEILAIANIIAIAGVGVLWARRGGARG